MSNDYNSPEVIIFLKIFGIDSWDELDGMILNKKKIEEMNSLEHFNKWNVWELLRRVIKAGSITKLLPCQWSGTTDDLLTLFLSIIRKNGYIVDVYYKLGEKKNRLYIIRKTPE